jgi:DNA-binding NarL/FixJ family response regulator
MRESKTTLSVVIVDDHVMFAESLARALSGEPDIEVVGVATNGPDAVRLANDARPHVMLIDYQLPGPDGVEVAADIKRAHPEIFLVMLTGASDERMMLTAIDAGCSGFLTKDRATTDVVNAVRDVANGEALISPEVLARILPKLKRTYRSVGHDLTARELEVLQLLAQGQGSRAIATQMHLSLNTVRNYTQSILHKLAAHSKLEAVATAVREGIISHAAS